MSDFAYSVYGNHNPDFSGEYYVYGEYEGMPTFKNETGAGYLWSGTGGNDWLISNSIGDDSGPYFMFDVPNPGLSTPMVPFNGASGNLYSTGHAAVYVVSGTITPNYNGYYEWIGNNSVGSIYANITGPDNGMVFYSNYNGRWIIGNPEVPKYMAPVGNDDILYFPYAPISFESVGQGRVEEYISPIAGTSSSSSSSEWENRITYYNPTSGVYVFATEGSQKIDASLSAFTNILNDVRVNSSQNVADICWESSDVYYCSYDGKVRKIGFDDEIIAELQLVEPIGVSAIQYAATMSDAVSAPPQSDNGCWIADVGTGDVIRTNENLESIYEFGGVISPSYIVSDIDDGCYVADDNSLTIIKLDSMARMKGVIWYNADIAPSIATITEMKAYLGSNGNNNLLVLANDKIYRIEYYAGVFTLKTTIDPNADLSEIEFIDDFNVRSIDVDRKEGYLYVVGSNAGSGWVLKYDLNGVLISRNSDLQMACPIVVRVVQCFASSDLYILGDSSRCL